MAEWVEGIPMKRAGKPEDVAGLVACGVIFALPGVVFGCAYGLYEALKGRDDPDA